MNGKNNRRQANLTGHFSVLVKCLVLKTIILKSYASLLMFLFSRAFFLSSGSSRQSGTLDLIQYLNEMEKTIKV